MTLEQLDAHGLAEVVLLEREREHMRQHRLEAAIGRAGIPRRFAGKDFAGYRAETPEQRHALATCRQFAGEFPRVLEAGYSLVLAGRPGTGKTHLACAVLAAVIRAGHTGLFLTISEALRAIRATYSPRAELTESEIIAMLIDPDLLVLDEVGVAIGDPNKRQALLFDLVNGRYAAQRPTVLIGNLDVDGMADYLGERIMDRILESGSALVPFTWPSYRTRTHSHQRP